jgi:hypothetical protein
MVDGHNGTSESLTVHQAASVFEGLLSEEENGESTETRNEDDDQPEQVESEEGSEESVEPEEVEGEEDGDAEEVEDEPDPKPRKVKIKNEDGSDGEVDEVEAGKGYMRTADYTRKTQALAAEKKTFQEQEVPAVRAERQKLVERLAKVEETYKALVPQEPDWDRLRAEQPEQFADTWAAWQQYKSRLEGISKEKAEAQKQIDEDNMRQLDTVVKAERERLLEAVPSWKDEKIAKKEKADMVEFALKSGFTEDQLKTTVDHKVLVLLRKAMLFDRAQSAKPAVQQKINRVKTATPGPSSRGKVKVTEATRALQRLAKTGRREDVQAAFEKMLDEDGF